jgi:hypothetical protein
MRICGGQHGKSVVVVVVVLLPYMAAPCKCAAHEAKACANWLGGAKCGANPCYLIRRLRDGKELAAWREAEIRASRGPSYFSFRIVLMTV